MATAVEFQNMTKAVAEIVSSLSLSLDDFFLIVMGMIVFSKCKKYRLHVINYKRCPSLSNIH